MIRVLYWTELYPPDTGGAEVASAQLLEAFPADRVQCQVVTNHGRFDLPDRSINRGIEVNRFWFQRALLKKDLQGIRSLIESVDALIESFRPDVIHLNTCQPSLFFFLKSTAARNIKSLVTICEPPGGLLDSNSMVGQMMSRVSSVVFISRAMRQAYLESIPSVAEKSKIIYYGLNRPDHPAKQSLPPNRIFAAGRIVEEKGFDVLIEAFAELKRETPELELTISGDGPELRALKELALKRDLNVRFTGWLTSEEVLDEITAHTVVVVPSRWEEPFGLMSLHAAQMERPVIVSDVGGLPETILPGKTGLIFERDNSSDLADKIRRILSDRDEVFAMGKRGRQLVESTFAMPTQVDAYLEEYAGVCDQSLP